MTPKKNIIRKPVHTAPDGSPIPKMGNFNKKENAFIYWFTNPGTEAFMNSGRAAVRAGYKPTNAVIYGYQLRQKPEISAAINAILERTRDDMRSLIFRIALLSSDRMFFDIADFYRQVKKPLEKPYKKLLPNGKLEDVTWEWDFEIIPLDEISERNRMCIDGITYKGKDNRPLYILPNREKAADTFFKCLECLYSKSRGEIYYELFTYGTIKEPEEDLKTTAEFLRGDVSRSFITHPETASRQRTS
jgi:hypothetical protein